MIFSRVSPFLRYAQLCYSISRWREGKVVELRFGSQETIRSNSGESVFFPFDRALDYSEGQNLSILTALSDGTFPHSRLQMSNLASLLIRRPAAEDCHRTHAGYRDVGCRIEWLRVRSLLSNRWSGPTEFSTYFNSCLPEIAIMSTQAGWLWPEKLLGFRS